MSAAISVEGVKQVVVNGLTVDVPRGAVASLVGSHGAGKTGTVALLVGLVAPSAGTRAVL